MTGTEAFKHCEYVQRKEKNNNITR